MPMVKIDEGFVVKKIKRILQKKVFLSKTLQSKFWVRLVNAVNCSLTVDVKLNDVAAAQIQ